MEERTQIDGSGEIYSAKRPEYKGFQNKWNVAIDLARTGGEILKDVGGRWASKLTLEVTKQAQKWIQERKRMTTDENNFVNLMTVVFQHSRSAMYSVFTMFMALLPIFMIFIHVFYYIVDRSASLITMRRKDGLWLKLAFVAVELIVLFVVLKFIVSSIFMPILSMQLTIISRMLFLKPDI